MSEVGPRITIDDPILADALAGSGLGTAPVGHFLRTTATDRWVRFHFFPSKRRPETPEDDAEVLGKFTAIGNRLFRPSEQIWVSVWNCWTDDDDQECYRCLSRVTLWSPAAWHENLLNVARFGLDSFMLLSQSADAGLSCYDGGFDVFARDRAERDLLRADFAEWLSDRHDGL